MCILTHTHMNTEQGMRRWCSHWQDVSALDFTALPWVTQWVFSMLFCVSMPALIVVIDWLSWCCRIQNNNSGGSSSGKRREHWVNLRREEATLVICQLWASYNKLGIAIFIVLKWKMQAEPGRSILNTVLGFSLWAPREKALFPSHWALPHTSHPTSLSTWAHNSHSLPALGVQGLSTCLSLMWPFTVIHLHWNGRGAAHTAPPSLWQPCPFPRGLPAPRWGSMKPSQTSLLHLLPG